MSAKIFEVLKALEERKISFYIQRDRDDGLTITATLIGKRVEITVDEKDMVDVAVFRGDELVEVGIDAVLKALEYDDGNHVRGQSRWPALSCSKNEGCSGRPSRASCTEGGPWESIAKFLLLSTSPRRNTPSRSRKGAGPAKSGSLAMSRTVHCRSSGRSSGWRNDTNGCMSVLKPDRRDMGFIARFRLSATIAWWSLRP